MGDRLSALGLLLFSLTRSRGAAENYIVLGKGVSRGARGEGGELQMQSASTRAM
jgi:hypothetical protein